MLQKLAQFWKCKYVTKNTQYKQLTISFFKNLYYEF